MAKKINVAVLMGGNSPEHEISLISGAEVVKNLDRGKYEVFPIVIPKTGFNWQIGKQLKNDKIDVVFIVMHGPNGEDGTVQGFLESLAILYTGSGVLASALGMDKIYSRKLFTQAGLTVPKYVVVEKGDDPDNAWKKLKLPVFVHPHNQGSAIGSNLVKWKGQLKGVVARAHKYSSLALVDEYIKGVEVTCAILGNENARALPLVEIRPKHEYFDFEAKYDPKLTDEIVPARISKPLTKKAQGAALTAYKALGCHAFGRVDMIIKNNKIYVLEVNTIPGLTPVSLFPKAAKAAGITFPRLLDKIISLALDEKSHKPIV